MTKKHIILHDCLADWIDKKMPKLGGVRKVKIKCYDRLPFSWLPGFRKDIVGITLWNTIRLLKSYCPGHPDEIGKVSLLFHELVHVEQFKERPFIFPFIYIWDLIWHGYESNHAEVGAVSQSKILIKEYIKEKPWKR